MSIVGTCILKKGAPAGTMNLAVSFSSHRANVCFLKSTK